MKGGQRPGAGRPPKADKKVRLSCRVKPETKQKIIDHKVNIGPLIDEMMKGMQ